MIKIRIISGAYGLRTRSGTVDLKRAGDAPFEVEEAEAKRLVSRGVAAYDEATEDDVVGGDPSKETGAGGVATGIGAGDGKEMGVNPSEEENGAEGAENAQKRPEYTIDTGMEELRELLKGCGLTYKFGMSKVDIVASLDAYYADCDDEDGEAPPTLGVEEPVT